MRFSDGLLADASASVAGGPTVHEVTASYASRSAARAREVGAVVVRDAELPLLRGATAPLHVVLGGGAGQVAGPLGLAMKLGLGLVGIETTVRDLDDPAGNVRRVVAAVDDVRASGVLADDTSVYVEVPAAASPRAVDVAAAVAAEAGLHLSVPAGSLAPDELLDRIDTALDLETPFLCTGLTRALPSEDGPGFLNVLAATARLFDGRADARQALTATDVADDTDALHRARRWCVRFATTDLARSLADLDTLEETG